MAIQTLNLDRHIEKIKAYGEQGRQAAALAINESIEHTRQEAAEGIAQRYELPPSYVVFRMNADAYATRRNLSARISARKRATKFNEFSHKQVWIKGKTVARKRGGVKVKIKRQGSTTHFKQAFYMELKNGNTGIAVRNSNRRDDISVKYSTSVGAAFEYYRDKTDLPERMARRAAENFFRYLEA